MNEVAKVDVFLLVMGRKTSNRHVTTRHVTAGRVNYNLQVRISNRLPMSLFCLFSYTG